MLRARTRSPIFNFGDPESSRCANGVGASHRNDHRVGCRDPRRLGSIRRDLAAVDFRGRGQIGLQHESGQACQPFLIMLRNVRHGQWSDSD
jgi:hypothetical protein